VVDLELEFVFGALALALAWRGYGCSFRVWSGVAKIIGAQM
jgi:hypothetical protein